MKFKIILFMLIVSIFSSCTSNTFCPAKDVEIQIIDIENIWEKFNDAERLASSTPRISLNQSIQSLQEIRRELNNYEVEECLRKVKKNATVTMNHIIDGYMMFLNDEPEKNINDAFQMAMFITADYQNELEKVKECLPNCKYEDIYKKGEAPPP